MTRGERNTIYKEALIQYKIDIGKKNALLGICYYLHRALKHLGETNSKPSPYHFIELYLEIYKHKPDTYDYSYWFPLKDTQSRIDILKQAIKETELINT